MLKQIALLKFRPMCFWSVWNLLSNKYTEHPMSVQNWGDKEQDWPIRPYLSKQSSVHFKPIAATQDNSCQSIFLLQRKIWIVTWHKISDNFSIATARKKLITRAQELRLTKAGWLCARAYRCRPSGYESTVNNAREIRPLFWLVASNCYACQSYVKLMD